MKQLRTPAASLLAALTLAITGCDNADDPTAGLEEYRNAEGVAEEAYWPEDDSSNAGAEHMAALEPYDEAIASKDPEHIGFEQARERWDLLAEEENPAALHHLGMLTLYGLGGTDFDQIEGMKLVKRAAEGGYPPSQTFMGLLAEEGDGTMVVKDSEIALAWYRHGARGGHCASVRRLVRAYENGELGLEPDAEEQARWQARLDGCRKR